IFPNTIHCIFLWHITHKFSEKRGQVYWVRSSFKQEIDLLMHDTYDPAAFDSRLLKVLSGNKVGTLLIEMLWSSKVSIRLLAAAGKN
ncbi:hypothetical protein GIB67_007456, partial [Kingdonia uniflora]